MRKRHAFRQMVGDACGHSNKLRERTHAPKGWSGNPNDFALLTEIDLASKAVKTAAAGYRRVECYPVSSLEVPARAADGFNDTRGFMSHYDWRKATASAAIVSMHVASTNTA